MAEAQSIQWFPGHMAKTRRKIREDLKLVDVVAEILDARIPQSSSNPVLRDIIQRKPKVVLLNKSDMADPAQTSRWVNYYASLGERAIPLESKTGKGLNAFYPTVREVLKEQILSWESKGMVGRPIRVMVVGIPNVGKSSFINRMIRGGGAGKAEVQDRPGVTRSKQWVPVDSTLELLDTPGILWPKFDDPEVGKRLAFTGAIKDDVLDIEELACYLMEYLGQHYTSVLEERYKIAVESEDSGYDLLEKAGRKRGFLMRGAQVDTERMARILLDEFRGGKLGRFTLETVEDAT